MDISRNGSKLIAKPAVPAFITLALVDGGNCNSNALFRDDLIHYHGWSLYLESYCLCVQWFQVGYPSDVSDWRHWSLQKLFSFHERKCKNH